MEEIRLIITTYEDDGEAILDAEETELIVPVGMPVRVVYYQADCNQSGGTPKEAIIEVLRLKAIDRPDDYFFVREVDDGDYWYRLERGEDGKFRWG